MLIKDLDRPKTSGRFNSLMELYENNYMLVRLFIPKLRTMVPGIEEGCYASNSLYVSRVPGCMDLELSQIEHSRYTTTFNLTYRFTALDRKTREPDLTIRIYHDARTCEVVTGIIGARRTEHRRVRSLDKSWRMNRFLHKWIRYCIIQGHDFSNVAPQQRPSLNSDLNNDTPLLV